MADISSQVLGKKVTFIAVTSEQMEGALRARQIHGLIEDYAHYARGEAAPVYSTIKDITGSNATGFEQFMNDYKAIFS